MIQNEKQYKITVNKLNQFVELVNEIKPFIDSSLQKKLEHASYCQIRNQLDSEVKLFLKTK